MSSRVPMEETVAEAVRRRIDHRVVVAVFALVASLASWCTFQAPPAVADEPTTTTTTTPTPPVTEPDPTTTTSPDTTAPPGATDPGPLPTRTGPPPLPDQPPLPPDLALPDPSPHIRVLMAQVSIMDLEQWQGVSAHALVDARNAEAVAQASVAGAQTTVEDAQRGIDAAHSQLGSLAVLAYMGSGDGVLSALLNGDSTAGARQREMLDATLERRKSDLRVAQQGLVDANAALDQARTRADAASQLVIAAQAGVDDLASKLADAHKEEADARANRPPASGTDPTKGWQLTLEGANVATPEELSAWFASQNHPSRANASLDDLTGWFVSEGADEGIRGDMAFAQAVVETGYFANPDTVNGNNFAGIGHCDTCPSGFVFHDVQSGVRGQIQLLKSYAEKVPEYKNPLVDGRLRGPAGCCQTWSELTHVWASDPNYGPVILGVYERLLTWVVMTRAANGGRPPASIHPVAPSAPVSPP